METAICHWELCWALARARIIVIVVYTEMSIIGGSQDLVYFHIRKLQTTITFDRKGLFSIGKKLLVGNYLLFHLCHSGGRSSEGVRGLARPQISRKTLRLLQAESPEFVNPNAVFVKGFTCLNVCPCQAS